MTKEQKKIETALHPFSSVPCEVIHLQPGDTIDAGDVYRSVTIAVDGSPISQDSPGLGRFYYAGDIMDGSPIHPECNVHFMRFVPIPPPEAEGDES